MDKSSRIVYFGKAFDELTNYIIDLVNHNDPLSGAKKILKKRIPFLITESFQNVIRHGINENDSNSIRNDFFQVLFNDDEIYIESSNIVSNKDKDYLSKTITFLNQSSKDDLKKLSREVLENGEMSNRGGAGLGLIEIARKTGSKIMFDFKTYNASNYHFFMSLKLQNNEEENLVNIAPERLISDFEFYKKNKVLSIFQGKFTDQVNKDIINVFNQNIEFNTTKDNDLYRSIMTLIEVLQNITKHGLALNEEIKGKLMIYMSDNNLRLSSENYVAKEAITKLEKRLIFIKSSSIKALKDEYAKILKKGNIADHQSIGLGLLEIALNSCKDFEYHFKTEGINNIFNLDIKL